MRMNDDIGGLLRRGFGLMSGVVLPHVMATIAVLIPLIVSRPCLLILRIHSLNEYAQAGGSGDSELSIAYNNASRQWSELEPHLTPNDI